MSSTAVNWAKSQRVEADSLGPKLVLLLLADRADEQHSCYPGQALLAEECGCSERSIRRFIDVLEEQGFLHREIRQRNHGRGRTSDRYFLHVDQPDRLSGWSDDQPDTADRTNRTPRVDQPDTGVQSKRTISEPSVEPKENTHVGSNSRAEQTSKVRAPIQDQDSTFAELWDRWPRKTGKRSAWQRWQTVRGTGETPDVIEAVFAYADAHRSKPRFCMALDKFLKRPEDEWRDWVHGDPLKTEVDYGAIVAAAMEDE